LYESGYESSHQEKKFKKSLDSADFLLSNNLLSVKTDVHVSTVQYLSNKKKLRKKLNFLTSRRPLKKRAGSGSVIQWYESADPVS
jgi:hypothetical protein